MRQLFPDHIVSSPTEPWLHVFSAVTHAAPVTYTSNGNSAVSIRGDLQINAQVSLSIGFNDTITVKGDFFRGKHIQSFQ
jgi:hypothetical protein